VRSVRRGPGAPVASAERAAGRRRAGLAIGALAPLLDALAEAGDLTPLVAARRVRQAVASTLGWRARLVPSPSPLAPEVHARVERGVALVPIAPGAGALRLAGADDESLRRVADLCAHAFARARSHPLEPGRRLAADARPRVLVNGPDGPVRAALAVLLGPAFQAVQVEGAAAAVEAGRVEPLDAVLLDLGSDPSALGVLEALRADPTGAELPAFVLGGRADEDARLAALALGADFLSPPLSAAELRARVEHAVQQARSTRALRDEALTDPLTGLPNRRALEGRLHEELRRARRYRTPLACVMADLDHLKPINDTLGHASGDQALQGMAAVLHVELRATDFAARAGGDEFLLLLPHTGAAEAVALAERVRRRLGMLRLGEGPQATTVGASFGVAELGPDDDGQAMVDAADRALYVAKGAGRGQVRLAEGPLARP
jgi:diguanylate cyclase (GGDEF)-like protein